MSAAYDLDPPAPPSVRARTVHARNVSKRALVVLRSLGASAEVATYDRPRTRAECASDAGTVHAQRPCPWVSCKHHLHLEANEDNGSIKLNFPDREVWEMPETCALDVAARGGMTLEEVGDVLNFTRERIRQIECKGLAKLRERTEIVDHGADLGGAR